jgi:hypothetical protein
MMKLKLAVSLLTVAAVLGAVAASADRYDNRGQAERDRRFLTERSDRAFAIGACAGQVLAQQGLVLPTLQPGPRPSLDPAVQSALWSAARQCRSELNGTAASASPVPSMAPIAPSSPVPTDVPVESPSGAPSPLPS